MRDAVPHQRSPEYAEFHALVADLAHPLGVYAAGLVGRDLADDVVNEALTVAWKRRAELPGPPGERRAWVFGATRVVARTMLRSERRQRGLWAGAVMEVVVADIAESVVERDLAIRVFEAVPAAASEAVFLSVWAGLTARQAADVVGCSEAAMWRRLSRGRRALGEAIAVESAMQQGVDRGH